MPGKSEASAVLDPPFDPREEAATLPLERLEAEITQLAGNLAAAECRWLLLLAEFDRRRGWEHWGCRSLTHWLGWHCALDERAAREKIRVARALTEFPLICEQFAHGRLSYSKVRAITRIATPATEADLVNIAEHATAAQVERLVSGYRRTFDPERRAAANERHAKQRVQCFTDDDGASVIQARLDPEDGAFIRGVLEAITERSLRERPLEKGETVGMRRAAALMEMTVLAAGSDAVPMDAADRHLVVINVDETVLSHDEGVRCELDGGPGLAAETARRLACDVSCIRIVRDAASAVTDVGRKTRVIPRWMRRQLHARDGGCVFPGCPGTAHRHQPPRPALDSRRRNGAPEPHRALRVPPPSGARRWLDGHLRWRRSRDLLPLGRHAGAERVLHDRFRGTVRTGSRTTHRGARDRRHLDVGRLEVVR